MNTRFDFNNLPPEADLEAIIGQMDADECLAYMNLGQQIMLREGREVDPRQLRACMLITRRFRSLRETKTTAKRAPKQQASLGDLMNDLG